MLKEVLVRPSAYVWCPEIAGQSGERRHGLLCHYRCVLQDWGTQDCLVWLRNNWQWQKYYLWLLYNSQRVSQLVFNVKEVSDAPTDGIDESSPQDDAGGAEPAD